MSTSHVHVVLAAESMPPALPAALERSGATTSFWPLQAALQSELPTFGDAIVIVAPHDPRPLFEPLEVLFDRLADNPRPVLVISDGASFLERPNHPDCLPVTFAGRADETELAARLTTMLELRRSLRANSSGPAGTGTAAALARLYKTQLQLASRVQRELAGQHLPRLGPVTFSTVYRPIEFVSGDVYEVAQLDDETVGFFIADATGHGLPAAMLTTFIRRAMRREAKVHGAATTPSAVLAALNEDLIDANLSECPFVAAAAGVINTRTLEAVLARAGMPYPIIRAADGTTAVLRTRGCVLGVVPDTEFETRSLQLEPGDSIVLHSDGLELLARPPFMLEQVAISFTRAAAAVAGAETWASPGAIAATTLPGPNTESECDADARITQTAWYQTLVNNGPAAALEHARLRFDSLRRMGDRVDDLTILAIQVDE